MILIIKKTRYRIKKRFTWNYFQNKILNTENPKNIYIFTSAGNEMVEKSFNRFVIRNSNLVQKMSPRRFQSFCPHHSNQTLVYLQNAKGT